MKKGFTLTELLIAVALIGVIAVFTVPKVLNAQGNKENIAKTKQFAAGLVGAYTNYQLDYGTNKDLTLTNLTPYLNYVEISTTAVGDYPDGSNFACDGGTDQCLRFPNGGIARFKTNYSFGSTNTTNAVYAYFDPDGKDSNLYGVQLYLYYDGQIKSSANVRTNTCGVWGGASCWDGYGSIPSWFNWE